MAELRLGVLGSGKMATAMVSGLIGSECFQRQRILASDPIPEARTAFQESTGAAVTESNLEVVQSSDVILLCVKPAMVVGVLSSVREALDASKLVVSIAAGVSLETLASAAGSACRLMRAMPNTPALVGASATAYALGPNATEDDAASAQKWFGSVGLSVAVPESLMDAVTGLSGSGPAYAYLFLEALSDAGVAEGLARETATKLAAQTLLGAATMVLETGRHPGELKDMVTSPGGTTIEAVCALERSGLRAAAMNAVRAAAARSRELG